MLKLALLSGVLVTFCTLTTASHAETLSQADREALSEKLDSIINHGKQAISRRQAAAYQAYKAAMSSETAALDLYLNCYEKVNFIEQGKKSSDFSAWKRNDKNKERLSDPGFRCALRHQLNWLVLTIEAAQLQQKEESIYALAPKAKAAIDNIYDDAKKLEGFEDLLKKDAKSSVFAKAYGFGTYKINDWPTAPLNIADVYEKIVFPAFREEKKPNSLREAWKQRIMYEELMIAHWSKKQDTKRIGMKSDLKPPEYYKFIENQKPNLLWQMEVDVFEAGDERGAASRMLTHIQNNIDHNNIIKWVKQLHEMVAPEGEELEIAESSLPKEKQADTLVSAPKVAETPQPEEPAPPSPPEQKSGYLELPD